MARATTGAEISRRAAPSRLYRRRCARLRRPPPPRTASRASQGLFLGLENLKDAHHVREVEDLLHGGAQSKQHELLVAALGVLQHFEQRGDSRAIDVADSCQVQS